MIDNRHAAVVPASVTLMLERLEDKDDSAYDHERIIKMVAHHMSLW